VVETEEENALPRAAVMSCLQPRHQGSATTNGALSTRFRQRGVLPDRGQRTIDALKTEPEFESEARAAELLVAVLAQERKDVIDLASHRTCSESELTEHQHEGSGSDL